MQATNNGLNHLVNSFILHCQELTKIKPAVDISYNTPSFAFLWAVAREGKPLEVSAWLYRSVTPVQVLPFCRTSL